MQNAPLDLSIGALCLRVAEAERRQELLHAALVEADRVLKWGHEEMRGRPPQHWLDALATVAKALENSSDALPPVLTEEEMAAEETRLRARAPEFRRELAALEEAAEVSPATMNLTFTSPLPTERAVTLDWKEKGRAAWDGASPGLRSILRGYDDHERAAWLRGKFADLLTAARWGAAPDRNKHNRASADRARDGVETRALRLLVEGFCERLAQTAEEAGRG